MSRKTFQSTSSRGSRNRREPITVPNEPPSQNSICRKRNVASPYNVFSFVFSNLYGPKRRAGNDIRVGKRENLQLCHRIGCRIFGNGNNLDGVDLLVISASSARIRVKRKPAFVYLSVCTVTEQRKNFEFLCQVLDPFNTHWEEEELEGDAARTKIDCGAQLINVGNPSIAALRQF